MRGDQIEMPDPDDEPDTEFDNDNELHRRVLIEALQRDGFAAYEYHSGGGLMHVVVDLVNDISSRELLQVATGNIVSKCDVGLMGWGLHGNAGSSEFVSVHTLAEAVNAFRQFYHERDTWIAAFRNGQLDV